jgi:hypothetical protein
LVPFSLIKVLAGMDSFIIKTPPPPIPQVNCHSAFGSVGRMLLELLSGELFKSTGERRRRRTG